MFMVDDRFYGSDPVMRLPRTHRAAAIGLWTLAGTWSAHFLKDGYVPMHMLEEFGGSVELADMLAVVKLWKRRPRGVGYDFLDWEKWQKTREQVETYRAGERQRKAEARSAKNTQPPTKPVTTGEVPGGQLPDSALPHPHPSPNPLTETDNTDQSTDRPTSEHPEIGSTGDNPVESVDKNDLGKIAAHARKLSGYTVDKLTAGMIAEHYLDRAKSWPANPTRFVLVCLTREELPVLVNFIQTGRWSE